MSIVYLNGLISSGKTCIGKTLESRWEIKVVEVDQLRNSLLEDLNCNKKRNKLESQFLRRFNCSDSFSEWQQSLSEFLIPYMDEVMLNSKRNGWYVVLANNWLLNAVNGRKHVIWIQRDLRKRIHGLVKRDQVSVEEASRIVEIYDRASAECIVRNQRVFRVCNNDSILQVSSVVAEYVAKIRDNRP